MPIRRYWSGLVPSVLLTTPAFTAYMVAYRQTKLELTPVLGADAVSNYILSGTAAEVASSFLWTPMEVIKGQAQLSASKSTLNVVRSIYKQDGLKGFFRGYWMGLVVFVPHSVVWWLSYESTKNLLVDKWLRKTNPNASNADLSPTMIALASATGTTAATCAANFLDVIKTRQQLAASNEVKALRPDDAKGVWTVATNLIKEVGLGRAFVKGLHTRLFNAVPSSVLTMIIVESLNPDLGAGRNNQDVQSMQAEQFLQ